MGRNERQSKLLDPLQGKNTEMARREDGRTVETPTQARQTEREPSVLVLLVVSLALAVIVMGIVWMICFRT
jgi:cobalamin biosynthesis Mg chelatase CobN